MRKFGIVAVMISALALSACGKDKKDAANAIRGMAAGSSFYAQSQVREAVRQQEKLAKGYAWLARFKSEIGPEAVSPELQNFDKAANTELGCGTLGGAGTSASPYTLTCTSTATDTFSCTKSGDTKTYTVASGATMSVNFYTASTLVTFGLTFSAIISGGDYNATSVGCTFGFTLDTANATSDPTIDCSNANFKCTVGKDTFDCSALQDGMKEDYSCT